MKLNSPLKDWLLVPLWFPVKLSFVLLTCSIISFITAIMLFGSAITDAVYRGNTIEASMDRACERWTGLPW